MGPLVQIVSPRLRSPYVPLSRSSTPFLSSSPPRARSASSTPPPAAIEVPRYGAFLAILPSANRRLIPTKSEPTARSIADVPIRFGAQDSTGNARAKRDREVSQQLEIIEHRLPKKVKPNPTLSFEDRLRVQDFVLKSLQKSGHQQNGGRRRGV